MISTRARFAALALFWGLPTAVPAQPADDSLRVPAAALRMLDIPTDVSRPMAMLRAIRVLHALPRQGDPTGPVLDFERLLDGLDRLERELSRAGERGISLTMTANTADRDILRDTLDALGLRTREQRRVFTVEPAGGDSNTQLRALLLKAGIDAASIQKRLNAGEAVHVAPPTVDIPLPIPFGTWVSDVFDNRMTPSRLFSAVIRSRDASLLYYGVQTMTPDSRTFLFKTPGIVQWLYQHAPIVAAFGSTFRVGSDGRVLMPGGAEAEDLWETLADEKLIRPDRFVRALFDRDGGRLAYFASTLWTLDDAHARFALGLWISDRRLRQERFNALYQVFAQLDPSWSITESPFHRPSYDAALLLSNLRLTDAGLMATPTYRKLWERAVDNIELPDSGDRQMGEPAEDGVADAAFIAGLLASKVVRDRRVTIERIDAGQRIFATAADADMQDVLVTLRAYGRYPSVVLALERLGIRKPAIYTQAARRVALLEAVDPASVVPLLAQFQGALAILERMSRTAAIPAATLEQLATSLIAVPFEDERYRGGVAEWLRTQLIPALPAETTRTIEERLLDTLVDRFKATATPFSWEGQDYVVDRERLRREVRSVRDKQKGNSLDTLLVVYGHVAAVTATGLTLDTLKTQIVMLRTDAAKLLPARPWPDAPDAIPTVAKVVDRAIKDLAGIRKQSDINKTARIVRPLLDALDYLLGETLVAVVYAASMGDTGRGPAAAVDVSHRHLFGMTTTVGDARRLVPWQRPTRGSSGLGDAVTGSVMGIDLALSKTRLRRLTAELPESPRLNANDRDTMTDTVALLNPRDLDDAGALQIATAIKRGRARVEQAAEDSRTLDVLAVEARIDASRRGLLDWTARHLSSSVIGLFSLSELFRLGGGTSTAIHGWGTSHEALTGCLCVQLPDDAAFELAAGRPSTGQLGTRVAELNLRVAEFLSDLRVPATLFPGVMALATQDFIDNLPLLYPDDWAAIAGRALAVSRERVEDYVSAVVASGPVRAVEDAGAR